MIHEGIDLHFTNMVNVVQNDNDDIIAEQKLPTSVQSLERFLSQFEESVQAVVECTGCWYWVTDWCQNNDSISKFNGELISSIHKTAFVHCGGAGR